MTTYSNNDKRWLGLLARFAPAVDPYVSTPRLSGATPMETMARHRTRDGDHLRGATEARSVGLVIDV